MKLKIFGTLLFLLCSLMPGTVIAQTSNSVEGDRQALVDLYNATNGDSWSNNSGWLSGDPSGDWYGIEVDANGRVTSIDLKDNNLRGSLPASIGNLTRVTLFDVRANYLGGDLPSEIGNMTSMVYLRLAGRTTNPPDYTSGGYHPGKVDEITNQFSGQIPTTIGKLVNMKEFWLERQGSMTGPIPSEIGNATSLEFFSIYGKERDHETGFTGEIPPEIGNCKNLTFLLIGRNAIGGTLPPEMGNLTNLRNLWIGGSNIEGSIPSTFANMSRMKYFFHDRNAIGGEFPFFAFNGAWPELNTFTHVFPEDYNGQDVAGYTGDLSSIDWSNVPNLQHFGLSRNAHTGTLNNTITQIDPEIFDFGFEDNVEGNKMSGTLPQFGYENWTNVRYWRINGHAVGGAIPTGYSSIERLHFSDNNFSSFDATDMIGVRQLEQVEVESNRLTPKDIVPGLGQLPGYSYGSQKPFDTEEVINLATGSSYTIDKSHQAYSGNSYQWYKDGAPISGATSHSLTLSGVDAGDEGAYTLRITHPDLSQTFESEPITVSIGEDGGGGVPGTPSLNSPQDGATGISTSPTLDWNSVSGAETYRLQVTTTSDFSTTVTDASGLTSTQMEVGTLDYNMVYYWRVQASNSEGTGDWSATRDFTTEEQAPAQPALVSPGNGATSVSTTPTLDWDPAERADTYRLLVSESDTFSETVADIDGISSSTTSYQLDGLDNSETYYWKVTAVNSGGSTESDAWNFTTEDPALAQPQLADPADGATDQPTTLTLSWNAVDGAETYRVQVADDDAFQSPVSDQDGIETADFTVENLENGTGYYWRVKAFSTSGESNWSEVRNFTTEIQVPSAPILSSPDDEATGQPTTLTLQWESSNQVNTYQVQLSTEQDFASTLFDQNDITGSSQEVSGLDNSVTYYWRVRASNQAGTGDWSQIRSFTTADEGETTVLPAPVQVSPNDGAGNTSITPTFEWEPVDGADYYILHSNRLDPSEMVIDVQVNGTTYVPENALDSQTTHHWRVRAVQDGVEGEWSTVWEFTTGSNENTTEPPAAPSLVSPSNDAQSVSLTPTFDWSSVDTDHYILQVNNPASSSTVIETEVQATTFTVGEELNPETIYSWRVRAVKDGVEGEWSSEWEFTTETADEMETSLGQNYPNPFNPSTQIRFTLGETQQVSLKVYDTVGRVVTTIVEGTLTAGSYERTFQADNLASGVYFLRFVTKNRVLTSQMTLMK